MNKEQKTDYRWFIWVVGWLLTFGMGIANVTPGVEYASADYILFLALSFFIWPISLGYLIFKYGF